MMDVIFGGIIGCLILYLFNYFLHLRFRRKLRKEFEAALEKKDRSLALVKGTAYYLSSKNKVQKQIRMPDIELRVLRDMNEYNNNRHKSHSQQS